MDGKTTFGLPVGAAADTDHFVAWYLTFLTHASGTPEEHGLKTLKTRATRATGNAPHIAAVTLAPPPQINFGEHVIVGVRFVDFGLLDGVDGPAGRNVYRDVGHPIKTRHVAGEALDAVVDRAHGMHD